MAMVVQTIDGVVANKFHIEDSPLKFGRTPDNQIQIDDLAVSNEHAQIICEVNDKGEATYFLEDMGSTNGSFVNEIKVEKQQLRNKDILRIGWNSFTFVDEGKVDIEETSEIKKSWIPGVYYTK